MIPLQKAPNGEFYHEDTPFSLEWFQSGKKLWYEERPRFIVHYYKDNPNSVTVFVNMSFEPDEFAILSCLHRALLAGGIEKQIIDLRLNNWSGPTNAFWIAHLCDPVKVIE